jgi:16S rRNA (guanine1207-N2)-methyltransferase
MVVDRSDAALEVLWFPFDSGALAWPSAGDTLFLRARHSPLLQRMARSGDVICEQSFAPQADTLRQAGWAVRDPFEILDCARDTARYSLVLVLPPRQREEARALLARAVMHCAPGGTVLACLANDEGAKSGEADLKALVGLTGTISKQHCRAYWSTIVPEHVDRTLLAAWSRLDAPRTIADGRFLSRPGVFAWDRIDAASALLASQLPNDLRGRAADLGAGYGYLSVELLQRCPNIVALDVYEAEARALTLAQQNLQSFAARVALNFHWRDVAAGMLSSDTSLGGMLSSGTLSSDMPSNGMPSNGMTPGYDTIVCNPPFHAQGRADRPDIGRAFIASAAAAMNPGGRLWLVANRHLAYEQALEAHFAELRTVAQAQGFKVIEAVKAATGTFSRTLSGTLSGTRA